MNGMKLVPDFYVISVKICGETYYLSKESIGYSWTSSLNGAVKFSLDMIYDFMEIGHLYSSETDGEEFIKTLGVYHQIIEIPIPIR